jgi:hypothetical protein
LPEEPESNLNESKFIFKIIDSPELVFVIICPPSREKRQFKKKKINKKKQ